MSTLLIALQPVATDLYLPPALRTSLLAQRTRGLEPVLLHDLLEDSAGVFHHHCAIIQRVFHEHWLKTLGEQIGWEQLLDKLAAKTAASRRIAGSVRECPCRLH